MKFFCINFCCLYFLTSFKINFALSTNDVNSISESKSAIDKDEENPVYLITGGYRPDLHTLAKYVVSIRVRTKQSALHFGSTHFCGGAILAQRLILTSAYCLILNGHVVRSSVLQVVASTPMRLVRTKDSQVIDVGEVVLHRRYYQTMHDIGLLKLTSEIMLDGDSVAAIPLPQASPVIGTVCTTLGWGRMYMKGPFANDILYVNLRIRDKELCKRALPMFSNREICASGPKDFEQNACVGDSGGPLICNGSVNGIAAFNRHCGYKYGVYTDVFQYLEWVRKSKCDKLKSLPWLFWFISFTWTTILP